VQLLPGTKDISLLHDIQTSCGVHPASGGTGARSSLLGDKVARTWNWPLSSIYCHVVNMSFIL